MEIGIKFQIPNKWGNLIEDILCGIELTEYIWKISEDEVYIEDNTENYGFLFPQNEDIFRGEEFIKIISFPSYYTVSANIQAYINKDNIFDIKTYYDFKESNCQIIILIVDNIFVSIYVKTNKILERIKANALLKKYEQIEYIMYDNDKMILN